MNTPVLVHDLGDLEVHGDAGQNVSSVGLAERLEEIGGYHRSSPI